MKTSKDTRLSGKSTPQLTTAKHASNASNACVCPPRAAHSRGNAYKDKDIKRKDWWKTTMSRFVTTLERSFQEIPQPGQSYPSLTAVSNHVFSSQDFPRGHRRKFPRGQGKFSPPQWNSRAFLSPHQGRPDVQAAREMPEKQCLHTSSSELILIAPNGRAELLKQKLRGQFTFILP